MDKTNDQLPPRYVTCRCQHCENGIEFDANQFAEENSIVSCPHCGVDTRLSATAPPAQMPSIIPQPGLPAIHIPLPITSPPPPPRQKRKAVSQLAKLTEETIRGRTRGGGTPVHRAAKNGTIHEIPRNLLQTELFMAKNNSGITPLDLAAEFGHLEQVPLQCLTTDTVTLRVLVLAAEFGHLEQVPLQCLTKELVTMPTRGTYTTDSGYVARTETPLHVAVRCGHAGQIPPEFLTPEFLSIEAKGDGDTLLHYLACANCLDLVPEVYADSEIWNLRNRRGQTPRDVLEAKIQSEAHLARVRNEPATEKQKDKLGWFGCTWDDGITKGQASDAIDECVRRFPEKEREYYDRPATEGQMAQLRESAKADKDLTEMLEEVDEEGSALTYGEAKDLIRDSERDAQRREIDRFSNPPDESQVRHLEELEFKLDTHLKDIITGADLDGILSLKGAPPREEDVSLFAQHGLTSFQGDGLAAFALGDLIRAFGGSAQDHNRKPLNYLAACQTALSDPDFQTPVLTRDEEGFVAFSWPKGKIREWLRAASS
jgi:hypothetical protein